MKKRYVFLIFGIIGIGILIPLYTPLEGKIVLIFQGEDPHHHINAKNIQILLSHYDYETSIISSYKKSYTFKAKRIIIIYIGHGDEEVPKITLKDGGTTISSLIKNLEFKELVLCTTSCYGGNWLILAQSHRLIISSTNDTITYQVPSQFSPFNMSGNLVNLFMVIYEMNLPLELAYKVWREEIMIPWYKKLYLFSFGNILVSPPVMDDQIEGLVWL